MYFPLLAQAINAAQAQQIVDIVKLGLRGNTFVDAMPIMAVGDVMAYVRNIAFESIKDEGLCLHPTKHVPQSFSFWLLLSQCLGIFQEQASFAFYCNGRNIASISYLIS